ncbi:MAG TPA: ABC transporter permease [Microlunatus sp.]|nr:ABC transporter permease [Microlunatus sp.]
MRRLRPVLLGLAGLIVAALTWVIGTTAAQNVFFPTPQTVLSRAAGYWTSPEGRANFASSLGNLLLGLLLAAVIGVAAGLVIGSVRLLSLAVSPWVEFARSIPSTALIPVAFLIFGLGDSMKLFLITLGSLWPILLNTIAGLRGIDQTLLDTAAVYRLSLGSRIRHVIVPAVAPRIATGIRIAIPISLILVVTSELVGSSEGIGFVIVDAQATFKLVDMWSGIVLLGLLGFLLTWLFGLLERRLLRWTPAQREPS